MTMSIKKILVPIDHSETSLDAAWIGLAIARSAGASLTLMHIRKKEIVELYNVNYSVMNELSCDSFHEFVLTYLDDPFSNKLCAAINNGVVDMHIEPCENAVSLEICKYAEDNGVNLIVMGSRGRSNVQGILLGSVSSEVVHHAPCAVSVVR